MTQEKPIKFGTPIARKLRQAETSAEELLWNQLRNRRLGGWKFRRQVPIERRVADFACIAAKLTIELDGAHHGDQMLSDAARREEIKQAGFLELRFSNEDVRGRLSWVVEEIWRALARAQDAGQRK